MRSSTGFRVLWLAAVLLPGALASASPDRTNVVGVWASKGSIFSITSDGEELHGEVIAMSKPRLDRKNPDPGLRQRPVIGLQVLSGYRFRRGQWRGKIYDPTSGSTFSSHLKLGDDGNLRVRGYIGFSLFGKTEIFEPVSTCSERIVNMLRLAEIEHLCPLSQ